MTTQRPYLIPLMLILVTAAVFSEVRNQEFVAWDDDINFYENPYLNPVTASHILAFWRNPFRPGGEHAVIAHEVIYTPVTFTTFALIAHTTRLSTPAPTPDGGQSDLNPRAFHLVNLLLHVANVLLVFIILRLLIQQKNPESRESPRSDWCACGGALLFALHPVQVEPVAWVGSMNTLLSSFFALLALWQYLCFAAALGRRPMPYALMPYALATLFFILALLSKPIAVVLPLLAGILDSCILRRSWRAVSGPLLGWLMLAGICVLANQTGQPAHPDLTTAWWQRPLIVGDALAFYLFKLLWPLDLAPDYGRTPQHVLQRGYGNLMWLVPYLLIIVICWRRQRWPWVVAALGIFIIALLPMSGIVPYYFHVYSTVADRYLYLALLGPALAIAWLLHEKWETVLPQFYVLVLLVLALLSAFQTLHWYNSVALFEHTLAVNPQSWMAHTNLGVVRQRQGKIEEALAHYRAALQIKPDHATAHINLGTALMAQGRSDEAVTHFRQALASQPNSVDAHYNLGVALMKQGKTSEAIAQWSSALQLQPDYPPARQALATARQR
ncbi:MAG: tetratricopeptide repeat protein [Armatimonadota bacterium]|nr:tetratricopeptide repeat protein [Armatimonadota bacterium]